MRVGSVPIEVFVVFAVAGTAAVHATEAVAGTPRALATPAVVGTPGPIATTAVIRCSATFEEPTWGCGGLCDDGIPCVVSDYYSTDCSECVHDVDYECQYLCIDNAYDKSGAFNYLIPYSAAQRKDAAVDAYERNASDGADAFPSNDDLKSIATMQLKSSATTVYVLETPPGYGKDGFAHDEYVLAAMSSGTSVAGQAMTEYSLVRPSSSISRPTS